MCGIHAKEVTAYKADQNTKPFKVVANTFGNQCYMVFRVFHCRDLTVISLEWLRPFLGVTCTSADFQARAGAKRPGGGLRAMGVP